MDRHFKYPSHIPAIPGPSVNLSMLATERIGVRDV